MTPSGGLTWLTEEYLDDSSAWVMRGALEARGSSGWLWAGGWIERPMRRTGIGPDGNPAGGGARRLAWPAG